MYVLINLPHSSICLHSRTCVYQVVEDAAAEYLAYFADKTISMIRAPDEYLYPAPFNLVEFLLIAPIECVPLIYSPHDAY